MKHRLAFWLAILVGVLAFPYRSPAPLVYRADEGWVYEKPGEDKGWQKPRAKDQSWTERQEKPS